MTDEPIKLELVEVKVNGSFKTFVYKDANQKPTAWAIVAKAIKSLLTKEQK